MITIPDKPNMDAGGLALFKNLIETAGSYLEYGCGGSTTYAYRRGTLRDIVSIESDASWADAVRGALTNQPTRLLLEYCDIGPVGAWGHPVNNQGVINYWRYMSRPWEIARAQAIQPDLVLIDGRFRVASFLFSLVSARVGTRVLFDDYFDRPQYFVAENFCPVSERHDRMALFIVRESYALPEICACIAQHSVIAA